MECYYHDAVPSVALCTGCKQPICPTCRSAQGDCPGCRLAARIDAAAATHELPGQVPPRQKRASAPPPPQPEPEPQPQPQPQPQYYYDYAPPQTRRYAGLAVRPESRALVALGYPLWPLALLALLDGSRSPFIKRQALQALGFNFGMYAIGAGLSAIATIPFLGISAWPLLPFVIPVTIVASFVYGFKVWQGEDINVPIIGDFIEDKFHRA